MEDLLSHATISEEEMRQVRRYAVVIEWSAIDDAFIATIPDLGTRTHGTTREDAATMADEVIALALEADASQRRVTPQPQFSALLDIYPNREHVSPPP